jgi:hypothetical protein
VARSDRIPQAPEGVALGPAGSPSTLAVGAGEARTTERLWRAPRVPTRASLQVSLASHGAPIVPPSATTLANGLSPWKGQAEALSHSLGRWSVSQRAVPFQRVFVPWWTAPPYPDVRRVQSNENVTE